MSLSLRAPLPERRRAGRQSTLEPPITESCVSPCVSPHYVNVYSASCSAEEPAITDRGIKISFPCCKPQAASSLQIGAWNYSYPCRALQLGILLHMHTSFGRRFALQ